MTYAEIMAARKLPIGYWKGMAFRHYGEVGHVFVSQFPLATTTPELLDGRLEMKWSLKRVGRAEGGHLVNEGFVPRVFSFQGFALVHSGCLGLDEDAARMECRLLYEFLRGNVEKTGASETYPDPLIEVGYTPTLLQAHDIFDPAVHPLAAKIYPFDPRGDIDDDGGPSTWEAEWYESLFVLEPDTFKYDDAVYDEGEYFPFSFAMKQVPRNVVRT